MRASWKAQEAVSTIQVHPDMLLDHFPHRFRSILKRFEECPDLEGFHPAELHPQESKDSELEAFRKRYFTA